MPRGRPKKTDNTTLQMAIVGYEVERQRLEDKIKEIRAQLAGGTAGSTSAAAPAARKRKPLSAAARKRIALAQRKRWAVQRKQLAAAGKS